MQTLGSVKITLEEIAVLYSWADDLKSLVHLDFVTHEHNSKKKLL